MQLSKLFHITTIIVGFIGVYVFLGAISSGTENLVFGITKQDALLCTIVLFLIALWAQVGAMHHMMLEKKGEWL